MLLGQVKLVLPAGDVRLHHLHRVAVGLAERAEEGRLYAVLPGDLPLLDAGVQSLLGLLLGLARVLCPKIPLS